MSGNSFSNFQLAPPIAAALHRLGFAKPTPIQAAAVGPQLDGRDLIAIAATGSGKTAAYGLPLLHQLIGDPRRPAPGTCRALVLAPTRELALQIIASLRELAGSGRLRSAPVVGGAPRRRQIAALARGLDLVVATPGRLIDLMRAGALRLGATRHLVLDEADRMLDLGFLEPVRRIAIHLAPGCQTVMFSATMPEMVAALALQLLIRPVRIEIGPPEECAGRVVARAELIEVPAKRRRLLELLRDPALTRAIVFVGTRRGADRLAAALAREGIAAGLIHGERSQRDRSRALEAFRAGEIAALVATDVVGRGIDVPEVSHVINFDLPAHPEDYIHRIGRTGRGAATGTAISLCAPEDLPRLRRIERVTERPLLPPLCRRCHRRLAVDGPDAARPCGAGCG